MKKSFEIKNRLLAIARSHDTPWVLFGVTLAAAFLLLNQCRIERKFYEAAVERSEENTRLYRASAKKTHKSTLALIQDLGVYRRSAVMNEARVLILFYGEKWEAKLDRPERFKGASDRNDTIEAVREVAYSLINEPQ